MIFPLFVETTELILVKQGGIPRESRHSAPNPRVQGVDDLHDLLVTSSPVPPSKQAPEGCSALPSLKFSSPGPSPALVRTLGTKLGEREASLEGFRDTSGG